MTGHGLYKPRELVCACGQTFTAKAPQATYCSNACRKRFGRYGMTHGTVIPRALGVTK